MSKMFKRIAALFLVAALVLPGLTAFANPQEFGPEVDPDQRGSITVTRVAAPRILDDAGNPITNPTVPGVPIRIRQVQFADGVIPTTEQLNNETWVAANAIWQGDWINDVTGENGEVVFNNLPLGIWFIEELATGSGATNPVDADYFFPNFIVGIPRWVPELDNGVEVGGEWDFDVRVYPKSHFPSYEGTYKQAVEVIGNVITWELGHAIPNGVGVMEHFSVTDMFTNGLSFVQGSVVGRFTRPADANDSWAAATGELVEGVDFEVVHVAGSLRVDIVITDAGRVRLAGEGLLVEGNIMFRLETAIDRAGQHRNVAYWNLGEEPCDPADVDCFIEIPCDPELEDCEIPCDPIEDPECDFEDVTAFSLEVLKQNTANQALDGAEFAMYRELNAAELAAYAANETLPAGVVTTTNGTRVVPLLDAAGAHITGTTVDGVTNFNGVPMTSAGTNPNLWLREVEAPPGYRFIDPWMPVNVDGNHVRSETGPGRFIVDVTVFNDPATGWELPETGGVGTIILTVVGLVLVGGALVLFAGGKEEEDVA